MKTDVITLQKALYSKGMSPSDLRKYSFSSGTIAKMMKGEDLRPATILKLANVLQIPIEDLVKTYDPVYELIKDHIEKAVLIG